MNGHRRIKGLQKDWNIIRKNINTPIITIITSTYNVAQSLHWTYESIKNQTYPYVQWIIVDGDSTDGTQDLLNQFSDVIDIWFSEPDSGIYDAWNKALDYVQGDWVQFIGAGDELYEQDTLKKVAVYLKDAHPIYDFVYGQVMHISEKGRKELYVSGEAWEDYKGKWEGLRPALPVQTGIYHHNSIFQQGNENFDTTFKIVADCHFLLKKIYSSQNSLFFVPLIMTVMPMGGISGSIKGSLLIHNETLCSMKLLGIKLPFKQKVLNNFKYYISKSLIIVMKEKRYEKFIDTIKIIRGKPKVFTIK